MCTGSRRRGAASPYEELRVPFLHRTDLPSSVLTTQTAKPHNHVVVNTIVNTVVNTAFFYFEPSPEEEVMKNNQLGIVVRTCSGSFVVPVGKGSFLCVSALKVSLFFVFGHLWPCRRGLNEGGCERRRKSSRPLGLTSRGSSTSMATSSPVCLRA